MKLGALRQMGWYIFVSAGILSCIQRTGIFPYNSIFMSDHRPCYIDIDSSQIFFENTPEIAPHQYRGLRLQDPRLRDQYKNTFLSQLLYHNIPDKVDNLLGEAQNNRWSEDHTHRFGQ
jgi:hypothetical protein